MDGESVMPVGIGDGQGYVGDDEITTRCRGQCVGISTIGGCDGSIRQCMQIHRRKMLTSSVVDAALTVRSTVTILSQPAARQT